MSSKTRTEAALCSFLLMLLSGAPLLAAETSTAASLADLSWIAGNWVGGEGETFIQEQWSSPRGDDMMGMFRMIEDGAVVFYEFMTLTSGESGTVLRIKHFSPGLVGWEEKKESVVFDLREIADQRAVFETEKDGQTERLVYERHQDQLVITLEKPAKGTQSRFQYQLQGDERPDR